MLVFLWIGDHILNLMLINQKGISLPIVVIALVIVFLVGYIVVGNTSFFKKDFKSEEVTSTPAPVQNSTPQPTQPSDSNDPNRPGYKLYTNSDARYQISYPEDWSDTYAYNYYDNDDDLLRMDTKQEASRLSEPGELQLSVGHTKISDPTYENSLSQFNKDAKDPVGSTRSNKVNGKLTKVENITLANNPGIKFTYEENYEGAIYGLIHHIKVRDTLYAINFFTYDKATMANHQREITEIINSFKPLTN